MKILKFGGTSVKTAERIKDVIAIIKQSGTKIAVVSALGGVTDDLINTARKAAAGDKNYLLDFKQIQNRHLEAAKKIAPQKSLPQIRETIKELEAILHGIFLLKEISNRSLDLVMSFGERLSAIIVSAGANAEFLDTRALIKTDENFGHARVDFIASDKNIQEYFSKHKKLQIATGFIASTYQGETTTLGRGGSDYTASILGAALSVEEIEIWTDVDGIMTADPRKTDKAFSLHQLSYAEAMELSHFGAKVIHPPTMQPALNKSIPIRIKNTMNPAFEGSVISKYSEPGKFPIKGISSISNISLLQVQGSGMIGIAGISHRLFGALAKERISIILISQASSEQSICFAIDPKSADLAKKAIEEEFALEIGAHQIDTVSVENDLSIIAVVGENMKRQPGTSGKLFQALGRNGINVIATAQGSSELNISIVIPKKDETKAISALHDALFLSDAKALNIFLVGTGLIGKTLLKQFNENAARIKEDQSLEIKVIALADSKKMLFDSKGIAIQNWEKLLDASKEKSDLKIFVEKMCELNLPNSIFVDCTASEKVAAHYIDILKSSISIATPNKKANSGKLDDYIKLALAASKSNARFYYEANVGAGLPILGTLKDLQYSGDTIVKIEAVLSGTLSYIFNSFTGDKKFYKVVREAQEKGYTEPDPRDDLNGLDVARKLLILARETGRAIDLDDIKVENLIPEKCRKASSIEEFFAELEKSEDYFQQKKLTAERNNEKLCYIATLDSNGAKVELKSINAKHPFYSLSGSDNIISFTTSRYKETPLVVKGPGAGAEVTAGGVFADILKISNKSFDRKLAKYSFLQKLKKHRLVLSLIGMSNIGKTFWSKRLSKLGFKHICCDDLIEKKLAPKLRDRGYRGIKDVAKWLGQPYDKQFSENQNEYLKIENETMRNIFSEIADYDENIVIDTTGSVIYTDEDLLKQLKQNSLVVYIEASPEMKKEMYQNFLKNPKPIIWRNRYRPNPQENKKEALARCYSELLEERSKLYAGHADLVIPFHQIADRNMDEEKLLSLIQDKL